MWSCGKGIGPGSHVGVVVIDLVKFEDVLQVFALVLLFWVFGGICLCWFACYV